jgi:hypothetical protein
MANPIAAHKTGTAINIKRKRLEGAEQCGQDERKGRTLARLTFSRSPHSEQNLAAAIDGTPADAARASFSRWMFGYGMVLQQYKSNRTSGEPNEGRANHRLLPFSFCLFLVIPYVSLEHYITLAASLVERDTLNG